MVKCDCNMNCWAGASMKLAVASFVLVVLKLSEGVMAWVHNTNLWWFVGAFAVFALGAGVGYESCCGNMFKKTAKKKKKKK